MHPNSHRFKAQLAAYSSAAAALCSMVPGQAQVVYHDFDPDVVINMGEAFALDLNNDGLIDFKFKVTTYGSDWYFAGLAPYPPVLTNVNAFAGYTMTIGGGPSIYPFPYALEAGVQIDSGLNWKSLADIAWTTSSYLYYFYAGFVSNYYGNILGQWSNAQDKFLALRFSQNAVDVHYAWVRCSVNAAGTQIVLKDYAYQQTANTPIVSGVFLGSSVQHEPRIHFQRTNDWLVITALQGALDGMQLHISNTLGQTVMTHPLRGNEYLVSVASLPHGMLMCHVMLENQVVATEKLIR